MTVKDDIRRTLTDPTPLYFAAGVLDKIWEEAPDRIAAMRTTNRRELQGKVTAQAKQTQARVNEALGDIDADLKKLREQAQSLAAHGLGLAGEYASKARLTYGELAERGRGAVRTWRGEDSARTTPHITVEREKTDES
jgi:hypothetical protein